MAASEFSRVDEVRAALVEKLGAERRARAVGARVTLRTGVDLSAPRPDQNVDPAVLARVLRALSDMGYQL